MPMFCGLRKKWSFKALLECANEMKLTPFNVLFAAIVIIPHGVVSFMKPVKQLPGRNRKIVL